MRRLKNIWVVKTNLDAVGYMYIMRCSYEMSNKLQDKYFPCNQSPFYSEASYGSMNVDWSIALTLLQLQLQSPLDS